MKDLYKDLLKQSSRKEQVEKKLSVQQLTLVEKKS